VGLYETGLEDFDQKVILGDIKLVRKLNNWADSLAGGFEVFIEDASKTDQAHAYLLNATDRDLYVEDVSDLYFQIFDWLTLLDRNVVIFLTIILFVAGFNMISIILILIMERTHMIGLLKALGASDHVIRRIFVYNGGFLVLKGLLIGNALGLGLGFIQYYFKVIPLDPVNYYMEYVPIEWDWFTIITLNVMTVLIIGLVLFIPAAIISRIRPIRAIRFD
jgi:lipoprotein-releasing system permease protein